MSAIALSLALFAACLHATWNAMVKVAPDRALVLAAIAGVHTLCGLAMMSVAGVPAVESWPYIAASALLHYFYYLFLFESYRFGDLSQVYPIARGMAPLLVALGALLFAGEVLSVKAWIAIIITSSGIMAIAFMRRNPLKADRKTLAYTLANGVIIAAYSIVDGIGVRLSGDPLGYMAWLFFSELPVAVVIFAVRRHTLPAFAGPGMSLAVAGGVLSVAAYGIVLYANTLAPLGAVSAVRESSVIIAALLGTFLLGETPRRHRLASAAVVATGIIMLASVR